MTPCLACGGSIGSRAHGRRYCSVLCRREGERLRYGVRRDLDALDVEERRLLHLESLWAGRDDHLRRVGGADRIPDALADVGRRRLALELRLVELGGRL